eukprot:TRINITY_DN742_c0_g1_i1.p1 TRINITY_DN742_c0_g1~~TRINITY_DN742_c0_g1_i1.p1  ORF type:complete len:182 (-),score=14.85 TRINITY_DN742_c0_g1_i1:510-1016(-)
MQQSKGEKDVLDRLLDNVDNSIKQIENVQKSIETERNRTYFQTYHHQLKTKPYQTLGILFWSFAATAGLLALRYEYLYQYQYRKFSGDIEEFQHERERLSDEIFHLRDQIKKIKADVRGELPRCLDLKTLRDNVMVAMGFQRREKVDAVVGEKAEVPQLPPPNPKMIV